jgi:hypothetical protein
VLKLYFFKNEDHLRKVAQEGPLQSKKEKKRDETPSASSSDGDDSGEDDDDDDPTTRKKKKRLMETSKYRRWHDSYKQLQRFYNMHGHCNVPEDGIYYALHLWCHEQVKG